MMEVQRYPSDYDGVVAGNPAADRTNEIIAYLWNWLATHAADGTSLLAPAKLQLLTTSAVAACDADDGVKDGVIDDPRRCRFDPASLVCSRRGLRQLPDSRRVDAVRKVYDGPEESANWSSDFSRLAAWQRRIWSGPRRRLAQLSRRS